MKFKVGDKIICNSNHGAGQRTHFHKGGIYTVRRYDRYPSSTSVPIEKDDVGSTENGWHVRYFEHIDPEIERLWKLLNEI